MRHSAPQSCFLCVALSVQPKQKLECIELHRSCNLELEFCDRDHKTATNCISNALYAWKSSPLMRRITSANTFLSLRRSPVRSFFFFFWRKYFGTVSSLYHPRHVLWRPSYKCLDGHVWIRYQPAGCLLKGPCTAALAASRSLQSWFSLCRTTRVDSFAPLLSVLFC